MKPIKSTTLKELNEKISLPELYEKYSNDIFKYSFSILKNNDEAKDAVQEVFVKYIESESTFQRNSSYKTWLLVLTRNYCYNRIKSKGFKNFNFEEQVINKTYEVDYDTEISIKEALLQLNSEDNELIFLREYESYSYKEIAEHTDQSLENVKIKIFRARKKLREILK
ncbi:MAG: RNA polymerase sigma factor [Melioribacteraceae bacterium]|nr:RNA polymerase sigma factor [Melioribacteraceae bacterium]